MRTPVKLGVRQGGRVEVLHKQTVGRRPGQPAKWAALTGDEVIVARPGALADGQEVVGQ